MRTIAKFLPFGLFYYYIGLLILLFYAFLCCWLLFTIKCLVFFRLILNSFELCVCASQSSYCLARSLGKYLNIPLIVWRHQCHRRFSAYIRYICLLSKTNECHLAFHRKYAYNFLWVFCAFFRCFICCAFIP